MLTLTLNPNPNPDFQTRLELEESRKELKNAKNEVRRLGEMPKKSGVFKGEIPHMKGADAAKNLRCSMACIKSPQP